MKVLISNDDSIHSQGIKSLFFFLQNNEILNFFTYDDKNLVKNMTWNFIGDVWMVAPEEEQSAQSHSFSLHRPIFIHHYGDQQMSLRGTPADCVYFALTHLQKNSEPDENSENTSILHQNHMEKNIDFDWVVSGINHGSNLGSDIYYSGTVAGAREGCLRGYPSVAISLHPNGTGTLEKKDFDAVAFILKILLFHLPKPPYGTFYNINIPQQRQTPASIRLTNIGLRLYRSQVIIQKSPRGQEFCWLGGPPTGYDGGIYGDDCDIALCDKGHITISVIHLFGKECSPELFEDIQNACRTTETILSQFLEFSSI